MPSPPTEVEIREYRERLLGAFPPSPLHELVSTHDECDDGIHLRRELAGKQWDQLSPGALFHASIALPLLEPQALVSFLPAWLLRSMETFGPQSMVLEFTLYFLCPGSEDEGWDEERLAQRAALFNPVQKRLVADLLRAVLRDGMTECWHGRAEFGLRWWGTGAGASL